VCTTKRLARSGRKAAATVRWFILTGSLLVWLSAACSTKLGPAGSRLDAEAKEEAEKFWATQTTRCGDSYYRKQILPEKDNYVLYFQMRDAEVVVTPNKVSEADRLNGIEWKGETSFRPKASRVWGTEKGAWYEWKPGMGNVPDLSYGMRKVNGRWAVNTEKSYVTRGIIRYEPVKCSEVPQ
jgi:hypothetical protein